MGIKRIERLVPSFLSSRSKQDFLQKVVGTNVNNRAVDMYNLTFSHLFYGTLLVWERPLKAALYYCATSYLTGSNRAL